jgi:hypothetical protein
MSLVAGCGARTGLDIDGASNDASAPDSGITARSCPSDVEPGAPTPMQGFCSTRAHLATTLAPKNPAIAWSTKLGSTFQPLEAVVDSNGRVYANIDPDVMGFVDATTLVAVDLGGDVAWSHTFASAISTLYLGSDRTVHVIARDPGGAPTLFSLSPDGVIQGSVDLPVDTVGGFAIGSDGSLYSAVTDYTNPDVIEKLTPDGDVVWTSLVIDPNFPASASELALTRDDHVVVATLTNVMTIGSTVFELDANGGVLWQTNIDGDFTQGPSIAADGSIRMVSGATDPTSTTLVYALGPSGNVLWRTDLGADSQQTSDDTLAVGPDGTTVVRTFQTIFGLDPSGAILWKMPMYGNGYFDAAFDPSGALVLLSGDDASTLSGLDPHTGTQLWSILGPVIFTGIAFGPSGTLFALGGEGEITRVSDP